MKSGFLCHNKSWKDDPNLMFPLLTNLIIKNLHIEIKDFLNNDDDTSFIGTSLSIQNENEYPCPLGETYQIKFDFKNIILYPLEKLQISFKFNTGNSLYTVVTNTLFREERKAVITTLPYMEINYILHYQKEFRQ